MSNDLSPAGERIAVDAIYRKLVEVGMDLLKLYHFDTLKFNFTKTGDPLGTLELSVRQIVTGTICVTVGYYEARITPKLGTGAWMKMQNSGEIFSELEKVLRNANYESVDHKTYTRK